MPLLISIMRQGAMGAMLPRAALSHQNVAAGESEWIQIEGGKSINFVATV